MNILYKLFRQDPDSREDVIFMTSLLGILINIVLAAAKIIIGTLAASITIVSEGINNATDSLTAVLTIVGTKLAAKKPTKKYPFGYGHIEYLTSLVIAVLILMTGFEFIKESVARIFSPSEMNLSLWVLLVIAASALIKVFLGTYTIKKGKEQQSDALIAVGTECRNDSFISFITIFTTLIYLFGHVSIDAYTGLVVSLIILRAGYEVLKDTVSKMLGTLPDKALADNLYRQIRRTDGIINAADLMLHNYGPNAYSGSVNVEVDHKKTIGEIYEILHDLQLRIMYEQHVTMVFGIYAVDNDHPEVQALRKKIVSFIRERERVTSYHALYLRNDKKQLYCDIIVDYDLEEWDKLEEEFKEMIWQTYPGYEVFLVVETEYV
ncbi:MAG: cation diffusion facilitator family transporter [Clostridiales bacterium]|nr:cation diffusion facilitator family transporter [Clostridiales bacterium]